MGMRLVFQGPSKSWVDIIPEGEFSIPRARTETGIRYFRVANAHFSNDLLEYIYGIFILILGPR